MILSTTLKIKGCIMWYAQYIYIHNALPSPTWLLPFFSFLVILFVTAAN